MNVDWSGDCWQMDGAQYIHESSSSHDPPHSSNRWLHTLLISFLDLVSATQAHTGAKLPIRGLRSSFCPKTCTYMRHVYAAYDVLLETSSLLSAWQRQSQFYRHFRLISLFRVGLHGTYARCGLQHGDICCFFSDFSPSLNPTALQSNAWAAFLRRAKRASQRYESNEIYSTDLCTVCTHWLLHLVRKFTLLHARKVISMSWFLEKLSEPFPFANKMSTCLNILVFNMENVWFTLPVHIFQQR